MVDMKLHKRFWSKVNVGQPWECWEWTAHKEEAGYGKFKLEGRMQRSHRVSWTLTNGDIPTGLCILHRCDFPACVNPNHLFIGTQIDNIMDRDAKGRNNYNSGESHHNARLDETDVKFIRYWLKKNYKHQKIADVFGVSRSTITDINGGRSWKIEER